MTSETIGISAKTPMDPTNIGLATAQSLRAIIVVSDSGASARYATAAIGAANSTKIIPTTMIMPKPARK